MEEADYPNNKKYRIYYRYRRWIGKPDPSGFGTTYVYSDDPGWITQECSRLKRQGHQILKVQRNADGAGKWETM